MHVKSACVVNTTFTQRFKSLKTSSIWTSKVCYINYSIAAGLILQYNMLNHLYQNDQTHALLWKAICSYYELVTEEYLFLNDDENRYR